MKGRLGPEKGSQGQKEADRGCYKTPEAGSALSAAEQSLMCGQPGRRLEKKSCQRGCYGLAGC